VCGVCALEAPASSVGEPQRGHTASAQRRHEQCNQTRSARYSRRSVTRGRACHDKQLTRTHAHPEIVRVRDCHRERLPLEPTSCTEIFVYTNVFPSTLSTVWLALTLTPLFVCVYEKSPSNFTRRTALAVAVTILWCERSPGASNVYLPLAENEGERWALGWRL